MMNAIKETYLSLETAFFRFNECLFGGDLPECLITLNRSKNSCGYFCPERFQGKNDNEGKVIDEISMNPDTFGRDDMSVLSTLAHEMVHLWQERVSGKPCRRSYHDKTWANKMEEIGLTPSDTGEPGGKKTGQKMTHYITPGGKFEAVAHNLLNTGGHIHWTSFEPVSAPKKGKSGQRVKYTCPGCGLNMWGKPGAKVACMECDEQFEEK